MEDMPKAFRHFAALIGEMPKIAQEPLFGFLISHLYLVPSDAEQEVRAQIHAAISMLPAQTREVLFRHLHELTANGLSDETGQS